MGLGMDGAMCNCEGEMGCSVADDAYEKEKG